MNQTRCIGIIVFHRKIFFLYNMGNRLIYFNKTVEARTKEFIMMALQRADGAREIVGLNLNPSATCIVFADSYTAIPKLVFKRKAGCITEANSKQAQKIQQMRDVVSENISLNALTAIFSDVYFSPIRYSSTVFETVTQMTPEYKKEVINKWVALQPSLRRTQERKEIHAVMKKSGAYVFLWLDNNLAELNAVRSQNVPVHIIIPIAGAEQSIARIFGPNLLSVSTLKGMALQTKRYDENGQPIKDVILK